MTKVAAILAKHGTKRDACIKILQEIQQTYGYLAPEALRYVTEHSQITKRQIHGVATFYDWFRFKPVGKHLVRTCHGTACHVNGAQHTTRAAEETLKIKDKETTPDGLFTLETVACLGCCSLAPVVMIGEAVHGRLTPTQVRKLLKEYQRQAKPATQLTAAATS